MLMSQTAISASVMGLPRLGVCAGAALAPRTSASPMAHSELLRIDMLDLPLRPDAPAGDAVVMLVGEAQHIGRRLGLAAQRDEFGTGRLHRAALVPGAALQHRGPAVP